MLIPMARDRPTRSPRSPKAIPPIAAPSINAAVKRANAQMPDAGWEIRTRNNASPALERHVERFTQFLTLVGLTALLGFFHYVTKGPNEVERKDEEAAKRLSGDHR